MPVKLRKYNNFFHLSLARIGPPCHAPLTVRGRAPRRSIDHLPTNNAQPKDHDHGHEEEEEGEEGCQEGQGVLIGIDAGLARDRIAFKFARRQRCFAETAGRKSGRFAFWASLLLQITHGGPCFGRRTRTRSPAQYRRPKPPRVQPS